MYGRDYFKNEYHTTSNKANKSFYINNKSSFFNYNNNLNCIKANKNIYTLLKDKMKFKTIKNEPNLNNSKSFNYQNFTSNNSHRESSYLNNHPKINTIENSKLNKNNTTINQNKYLFDRKNNKSHKNIFYSSSSGFKKIKLNKKSKYNIDNINNIQNINNFDNLKKNKIDIIIDNLKKEIGAKEQLNKNFDINNQNFLYRNKDNKLNANKSFNDKSFSININNRNIIKEYNFNNYNINNNYYFKPINNSYYEKKIKNKNCDKNFINANSLINRTYSNKNFISLKSNNNKKRETHFFNDFNNNKTKSNNFLFTQNNINNYYILNTYDNKENCYRNNNINNKKYNNSTTNIYIKKNMKNNLFFDIFKKEKEGSDEYSSNNITLNINNNFRLKRNNSIFDNKNKINRLYNPKKEKKTIENNYNNMILNYSKSKINTGFDTTTSYLNAENNNEDSIDINNIDDSSILDDNKKNILLNE